MSQPEEPLEFDQAVDLLAGLAIVVGFRAANEALASLRQNEDVPPISPGVESLLISNFIYLSYFWIDRSAFSTLGVVRRDRLMDNVRPRFISDLFEATGVRTPDAALRESVESMLDQSLLRWAPLPPAPKPQTSPKGTLFWEFGKEIARLVGRPDDFEAMMATMIPAGTCTKVISEAGLLSRIRWDADN